MMATTSLIRTLSIDIETYSSVSLKDAGVYKYAEAHDFEILLFGYSVDGQDVKVVDLANGESIPSAILAMLEDESVTKFAFNASFERVCLSRFLGYKAGQYLSPKSWKCTMVWSAYLGLPLSLKGVGQVLRLEEQKMDEGHDLIRFFCAPCKGTKKNGNKTRNLPYQNALKWELFKSYNKRDVEVEKSIQFSLKRYPVPEWLWDEYHLDQEINDRGVLLDQKLMQKAIEIDENSSKELTLAMKSLTDLENPNSVSQVKSWLEKYGVSVESLGKKKVAELMGQFQSGEIHDALTLRTMLSKTSIKKYEKMRQAVCSDGRIRGMFSFYGANRTGRFSSRLVQLQNLPQNHLPDLKEARQLTEQGNELALDMLYEDIPDTLSQLIRTAFIPSPGYRFIVSDFSAIEARVIAWYADQKWRIEAFKNGEDIYCASASKMFRVPVEKHGKNANLRQKGKIAELALGYGGACGALKAMGALDMGLKESELPGLVRTWREANPDIVDFWKRVGEAAFHVVEIGKSEDAQVKVEEKLDRLTFKYRKGSLFITLPSGRFLAYQFPKITINEETGNKSLSYMFIGPDKKWGRIETYGPKLVENIVQATARDILCHAMKGLRDYRIVMHVHDELIIEAKEDVSLDYVTKKMAEVPSWAEGLLLRADGYECQFYQKD